MLKFDFLLNSQKQCTQIDYLLNNQKLINAKKCSAKIFEHLAPHNVR